jgi:predicted hydrocarbon binding protein
MKGVVFALVEDVVIERFGFDMWDEVLDRAEADGVYTSLADYPDAELTAIVGAIAEITGSSVDEVLVLAGRAGFAVLAAHHADLVEPYDDWRELVSSLDNLIHPEVRKIYAGAEPPRFSTNTSAEGRLLLEYRSGRGLCRLAEGLVRGAGAWFSSPVEVVHTACDREGSDACVLEVRDA